MIFIFVIPIVIVYVYEIFETLIKGIIQALKDTKYFIEHYGLGIFSCWKNAEKASRDCRRNLIEKA